MLRTLKDLFNALQPAPAAETAAAQEHALQLATAVLLVEVMRSDPAFSPAEREAVMDALRRKFSLSGDEIERLVELAEHAAREAYDYHAFTSRINEGYSMEQKIRIVEYMWLVAYADGHLSAHENHVMRRLSDLLYIPHGAYVGAKMRAQQASGIVT